MFIKRNHTVLAGKDYRSVLLVQGKRVLAKRPPGRPAAGAPAPKSVVIHQTLANLSKLPPELIELIERHCKHQPPPPEGPLGQPAAGRRRAPFTKGRVMVCWPPWMAWLGR